MKLVTRRKLLNNRAPVLISLPDLSTDRSLVPSNIVLEISDDKAINPASNLSCEVSGSSQFAFMKEPYFKLSNVINLGESAANGVPVKIKIVPNSQIESGKTLVVTTTYSQTDGTIIFQGSYDSMFSEVLTDVAKSGHCTTLYLLFNKKVTGAQLIPIFSSENEENNEGGDENDDGNEVGWLDTLELGETNEENSYVIEFSGDLAEYSKNLRFLTLHISKDNRSSDDDPLKLDVLAYGFSRK
jgi:hypothetical protein